MRYLSFTCFIEVFFLHIYYAIEFNYLKQRVNWLKENLLFETKIYYTKILFKLFT